MSYVVGQLYLNDHYMKYKNSKTHQKIPQLYMFSVLKCSVVGIIPDTTSNAAQNVSIKKICVVIVKL